MTQARESILKRLRARQHLALSAGREAEGLHVDPMPDVSPEVLEARFVEEAQGAGVVVMPAANEAEVFSHLSDILGDERLVLGWSEKHIPLSGYADWLASRGIRVLQEPEAGATIGITGADAALSTTGRSL